MSQYREQRTRNEGRGQGHGEAVRRARRAERPRAPAPDHEEGAQACRAQALETYAKERCGRGRGRNVTRKEIVGAFVWSYMTDERTTRQKQCGPGGKERAHWKADDTGNLRGGVEFAEAGGSGAI